MSRLIIQEDFLLLDKALQLKILIADLMIRLVPSQNNIIDKILSINENYKELLEEDYHIREKEMIDIISKKVHNEDIVEDKKKLLDYMSDSDSEDIDIISYNSWIRNNL